MQFDLVISYQRLGILGQIRKNKMFKRRRMIGLKTLINEGQTRMGWANSISEHNFSTTSNIYIFASEKSKV